MMSAAECDYLFKLVLIGDSQCGKSSLMLRYCDDAFLERYISTIGVDFKVRYVEVEGKQVKLQVWDTAGQQRFRAVTSSFYRGSHAILVVYSMSDRTSFENVASWLEDMNKHAGENTTCHLVASKCDEDNPVVSVEEGEAFAKSHSLSFTACSAKTGENVEAVFEHVSRAVKHRIDPTPGPVITVVAAESEGTVVLSGLSLSGAELGSCCVEDSSIVCWEAVPLLCKACGVEPRVPATFVTQDGFVIQKCIEFFHGREEVLVVLEKEDTDEGDERVTGCFAGALEARGLVAEDIDEAASGARDALGNAIDLATGNAFSAEAPHPITVKLSVKRRKPPVTLAAAFKLSC